MYPSPNRYWDQHCIFLGIIPTFFTTKFAEKQKLSLYLIDRQCNAKR
jgi:hypothetical protein